MSTKRKYLSFFGVMILFVISFFVYEHTKNNWPEKKIPDFMRENIDIANEKIKEISEKVEFKYKEHQANGKYMLDSQGICQSTEARPLDEKGITMLKYRGGVYYHPVNTAQCGLSAYNVYLDSNEHADEVIKNADKLIEMQDKDGALRYPFAWTYYLYGKDFPVGWTSAMAQAQAMSLFSRAYLISENDKYLFAGKKALDYLLTTTDKGGVMTTLKDLDPTLDEYIFFEEYVSDPANYTLNGYIYVLFGLHDWANLENIDDFYGSKKAEENFKKGIDTLKKILDYYDMETATAYDLGYMTFEKPSKVPPNYHFLHVMQLDALYQLTKEKLFKETRDKWLSYTN